MKRRTRNIIGAVIIAAVLIALVLTSIFNSYKYYHTVDEVVENYSELKDIDIKIAGDVKEGSVSGKGVEAGAEFILTGKAHEIAVDYSGQVPDTFKEGMPVVVEGRLKNSGLFTAYSLLTKCASRYEAKLE
jgi:cytochrome c-type biogenesis protein CcmE